MVETTKELAELVNEKYVPTAIERKKAVLMYFLVGIMISLSKRDMTKYELFHLKQSCGRWAIFFIIFILTVFMFFIPYVRILPVFVYAIMMIIWIIFVKQAREGFYLWENEKVLLPVFMGVGTWILDIFDLNPQGELNDQGVEDDLNVEGMSTDSGDDGVSDVVDDVASGSGNN